MRNFVISKSLGIIRTSNPDYSDEKMEVLEYGLTCLYMFVSKSVIIFTIAYFLGILKELIVFMIIYNILRSVSFGMHASSSTGCLIASAISFLSATYFAKTFILPMGFKTIFGLIGILYIYRYSPADTEKKPIISSKRRMIYKSLSTMIALLMVICSLTIDNDFISNSCILSLIIQCVVISPITYRLANQQYDNYKYYQA